MRIVRQNEPHIVAEAAEVLREGGIVLMPTDTWYALCADALSNAAVERVYAIKGRDKSKAMHALVKDINDARRFGTISMKGERLLAQYPGLISLVVPQKPGIKKSGILRDIDTFGFRIPTYQLCLDIIDAFGGPITATSANISGMDVSQNLGAIVAQLGPANNYIDSAIDGGALSSSKPSTVVFCDEGHIRLLREGVVPFDAIDGG
jgi:L-threonylcarbamoyladenylate synthase